MLSSPAPKQKLTAEQQKEMRARCEEYLKLLKDIDQYKSQNETAKAEKLETQANEMLKTFTPKMKQFCDIGKKKEAAEKAMAAKLEELAQINDKMGDAVKSSEALNKDLQRVIAQTPTRLASFPNSSSSAGSSSASNSSAEELTKLETQVKGLKLATPKKPF